MLEYAPGEPRFEFADPIAAAAHQAELLARIHTVPGARIHWDLLESPAEATILAVWCNDAEGRKVIALVPVDLAGVKRVELDGDRARWTGRGVFVAAHLLLRGD